VDTGARSVQPFYLNIFLGDVKTMVDNHKLLVVSI